MIEIRRAVFNDYYDILALGDQQLGEGYLKGVLKFSIDNPTWVAISKETNQLIGFVYVISDSKMTVVKSIAVVEESQRQGVCKNLLNSVLTELCTETKKFEVYAWERSDTGSVPLEKILKDFGFSQKKRVVRAWYDDSVKKTYRCPACGNPCYCDAIVFSSPSSYFLENID